MELAKGEDEVAIHSLWMEYQYDYESGRFLEWCTKTDKLVTKRRVRKPKTTLLDLLSSEGEV